MSATDNYLWLEDRKSERALEWVEAQNAKTVGELRSDPSFKPMFETALDLMTAEDNLVFGSEVHGKIYNFWQDKKNPLGLWRRTPLASYKTEKPEWETIIDFDALAAKEGVKWVFGGATRLYPEFKRALVYMSPDGGDASEVREFDIEAKKFVDDGFRSPASKSSLGWLDADTLLVSAAYEDSEKTSSGYPRVVKLWKRGQPLPDATQVFEIDAAELAAGAGVDYEGDKKYVFFSRTIDFFNSQSFLWTPEGGARHIPLPDDAVNANLFKGRMTFGVRTPWTAPDGTNCVPDALYSFDFEAWIADDELGPIDTILEARDRVSIAGLANTENRMFIQLMDNVRGKVIGVERKGDKWVSEPLALPENGNVGLAQVNAFGTSVAFSFTDFLTPSSIIWSDDEGRTLETVKSQPVRFDASGLISEQFEARSKDGTMIPYFVVRPKNQKAPAKTLLYAYGGFQIPLLPGYSGIRGKLWLEEGNVYVQANIRGGGEFGPNWHIAALKGNRQTGFDDFAAVAEDIIKRGITTPGQLGIMGGSNGGLLTGTSLVQRPDLFGAVLIDVPLLDMLRYTQLPPGASWIAEYGDPSKPEEAAYLEKYSPYQNASADKPYPPVLLSTSTADDRVHPGHARKMAAKLQELGHDKTLFFEETEGGHGGRGDQKPQAEQTAMKYVFLKRNLGAGEA